MKTGASSGARYLRIVETLADSGELFTDEHIEDSTPPDAGPQENRFLWLLDYFPNDLGIFAIFILSHNF